VNRNGNGSSRALNTVLSSPPVLRDAVAAEIPTVVGTLETLRVLFKSAKRSLKVFSPYVDASVNELLRLAHCPVRIVTTARDGRRLRGRPILERCATAQPLVVRYVTEVQGGTRIFQMHAKMVVADRTAAYLGSANLTDTSLNYNLELGLLIAQPAIVGELERIFDLVFERLSVPAQML
jgi:phosphatidylserine/phosphatidylglycerophosphate/cardiolipin synthase-like enzyme